MAGDIERELDQLQARVNDALLTSDWETLTHLVADDASIIGPRGFMIGRDTWIGVHKEQAYEQVRLETTESLVRAYDSAGLRVELVESECRYQGETIAGRFRVGNTWAMAGGSWKLVAVQYTSAPPAAPG
jgi:hypothetical protein